METISKRQLYLIGAGISINAILFGSTNHITKASMNDSWLTFPLAGLILFAVIGLLTVTARRFPDNDLFAALVHRFPVIGRIIGFAYVLFFFVILCRDLRSLVMFINIVLLRHTPFLIISLLILLCLVYIARGGVEVAARVMELWMILLVCCVILIPLLLSHAMQFHYLGPLLYDGMLPVVQGCWFLVAMLGEIVIMPLLAGYPQFDLKTGVKALVLGVGSLWILHMCVLLIIGPYVASNMIYPIYETVRQIHLTDFLDRLELPIVAIWMPTMMAKSAISLYVTGHGLKRIFPSLSARGLMLPLGILAVVCSYWFFQNISELLLFDRPWPYIAYVFELVLPVVLFLFLRPKRARQTDA